MGDEIAARSKPGQAELWKIRWVVQGSRPSGKKNNEKKRGKKNNSNNKFFLPEHWGTSWPR